MQRVVVRGRAPAQRVRCVENLRFTANLCASNAETGPEFASASAGFFMGTEETPGPVYGFGNPPNKIYKEAFLSGSQRENPYSYQGL